MMNFTGFITVFVLLLTTMPTENKLTLVSDNLYFDKTETSNAQWERFEVELLAEGKDSELYRKKDVFKVDAWNKTYFQKFKDYPVVGITKFGATEYCKWRNRDSGQAGLYRLPTKKEFLSTIKEGERSVKYFKKKMKFENDFGPVYNLNFDLNEPRTTSPIKSYLKINLVCLI